MLETYSLRDAALACLSYGWAVFPLMPNGKTPATSHGFKDATKDRVTVERIWTRMPDANIGIATGTVSGVTVVDIDVKNGAKGRECERMIPALLPRTFTVSTPTGGTHYYYAYARTLRSRNGFMLGVDIKSDGGYVVAPWSRIGGREYEVVGSVNHPFAPLSPILAAEIERRPEARQIPVGPGKPGRRYTGAAPLPGAWHNTVVVAVARMVALSYDDATIHAEVGAWPSQSRTAEESQREVQEMIDSARRKGFGRRS